MQWVPVTTAWHVLRLRIQERPPIRRVAANKLTKQSRTTDEAWSSSLGAGRVLRTLPCKKNYVKKHLHGGFLLWRQKNPEGNRKEGNH